PQAFLGYGPSAMEDLIDQAAARAGLRRYAPVAMTSFAQMADILTHTDFIAVFPSCVARTYAQRLVAHPLPFDLPPYGLYLCANPRSDLDPGLEWLMARVAENLTP